MYQLNRCCLACLVVVAACESEKSEVRQRDTLSPSAQRVTPAESVAALHRAQRALLPPPFADALIPRSITASDSGMEFELVPRQSSDPTTFSIGGGIVFVGRDGSVRIVKHYQ